MPAGFGGTTPRKVDTKHWQGPDILAMLLDMGLFPPTAPAPQPL